MLLYYAAPSEDKGWNKKADGLDEKSDSTWSSSQDGFIVNTQKIETQIETFGYVGVWKMHKHADYRRFVTWLIDEFLPYCCFFSSCERSDCNQKILNRF